MSAKRNAPESSIAMHFADTGDLQPGDTYEDGPYLVFTAQYHLRRGSCCHSDCRHCPYGKEPRSSQQNGKEET